MTSLKKFLLHQIASSNPQSRGKFAMHVAAGHQGAAVESGQTGQPGQSGWIQPADLDQALAVLQRAPATVLAGGTDLYPAIASARLRAPVLDVSRLQALREISILNAPGPAGAIPPGACLRIGAAVTWSQLLRADLPDGLQALKLAAREIGALQVQNRGTIGGNLCNASPAADSLPVLLALDASVELQSHRGTRTLAMADFVHGNRRTALAADELLTAVLVPLSVPGTRSLFLKLGHRRYLVISAASVAIAATFDAKKALEHCAIAVGACSVVAQRMHRLEASLAGLSLDGLRELLRQGIDAALLAELSPIDDVRGSAQFRRVIAGRLIARGLAELAGIQ
jgi:CO/xanthine dehydrogenase FAD-binding subunit